MNNDNKIFSINVNDIQQRQNNKDRYRLQVYKRLLERCYIKIKSASDNEEKFCLCRVPVPYTILHSIHHRTIGQAWASMASQPLP